MTEKSLYCPPKLDPDINFNFGVTVQDGVKTGAKTGVKLAYKHAFAPVFTSDGHPMLLVRLWPDKKMCRPEQLHFGFNFVPESLLEIIVEVAYII